MSRCCRWREHERVLQTQVRKEFGEVPPERGLDSIVLRRSVGAPSLEDLREIGAEPVVVGELSDSDRLRFRRAAIKQSLDLPEDLPRSSRLSEAEPLLAKRLRSRRFKNALQRETAEQARKLCTPLSASPPAERPLDRDLRLVRDVNERELERILRLRAVGVSPACPFSGREAPRLAASVIHWSLLGRSRDSRWRGRNRRVTH